MGRPSKYTETLAAEICGRLAAGESLRTVCAEDSMPSERTMFAWLAQHDSFSQLYARAKETRAHARFEGIDGVVEDMRLGRIDANVARVQIDTIKWQASKELPRKYGDRITAEHTGADGGPIEQSITVSFVKAKEA